MSSFTKATWRMLDWRDSRDVQLYEVSGLRFDIGYLGSGLSVTVPDGFVTDGPSIPKLVKWLLGKLSRKLLAWLVATLITPSAIHDMMRQDRRFSKLTTDTTMLLAMECNRTPVVLRWLVFFLVMQNRSRRDYAGEVPLSNHSPRDSRDAR